MDNGNWSIFWRGYGLVGACYLIMKVVLEYGPGAGMRRMRSRVAMLLLIPVDKSKDPACFCEEFSVQSVFSNIQCNFSPHDSFSFFNFASTLLYPFTTFHFSRLPE